MKMLELSPLTGRFVFLYLIKFQYSLMYKKCFSLTRLYLLVPSVRLQMHYAVHDSVQRQYHLPLLRGS